MPSARPFIWALRLGAAARHSPPERQGCIALEAQPATTVAQRVRTGARFTRMLRPCSEVFMSKQLGAPQEVAETSSGTNAPARYLPSGGGHATTEGRRALPMDRC